MTAIIVGVCLGYVALAAALLRFGKPWVNPMFFILVFYFFNYPLRALLLVELPGSFNRNGFTGREIMAGLEYSSLFVLVLVGLYILILKMARIRFDFHGLRDHFLDERLFFLAATAVIVSGVLTMGYEVATGGAFALGADIEELRRPFWVNVASLPYSLKWFALCMGFLLWVRSRRATVGATTALLCGLLLLEAFLTTGKGVLAAFILLFLFVDNLLTGRTFRASLVVVGAAVMVFFSTYSYYARYMGGIGLASLSDYLAFARTFLEEDFLAAVGSQLESILERGTYYFDALPLMMRGDTAAGGESYVYGSLVELLNLIPRKLGLVSEQYSFDRHVAFAVWGEFDFSQIFIGRIGESFFVLGYFGVFYAAIYAAIFALVASRWAPLSRSTAGVALYSAVLLGWLYQDASLVYQLKNLITILLCYVLVVTAARLSATPRRTQLSATG